MNHKHAYEIACEQERRLRQKDANSFTALYDKQTAQDVEAAMRERNIRFYETRQQTVDKDQAKHQG